jgi:uncharacterized membrane protein
LQPLPLEWLRLGAWAATVEFIGAILVALYCLKAAFALFRPGGLLAARLLVAEGAIWGLSFKVAATLLKLVVINTWSQIGMLAVTVAIRTLLKQLFVWEAAKLQRQPAATEA